MAPARVPANAQQTQGRGTRGGSAMSLTAALTHPARCRASGSHPLPRVWWLVPALWPSGNPRGHVPAQATRSAQRGLLFSQPRPCPAPTQASRLPAAKIPPRRASHRLAGTCLPSISHPVSMPGSLWAAAGQQWPKEPMARQRKDGLLCGALIGHDSPNTDLSSAPSGRAESVLVTEGILPKALPTAGQGGGGVHSSAAPRTWTEELLAPWEAQVPGAGLRPGEPADLGCARPEAHALGVTASVSVRAQRC